MLHGSYFRLPFSVAFIRQLHAFRVTFIAKYWPFVPPIFQMHASQKQTGSPAQNRLIF
jgi:hypothetical protein